jgi:hypothetical protein
VSIRFPTVVVWTDHALAKAQLLGIARADVEDAVLADHEKRTRNLPRCGLAAAVRVPRDRLQLPSRRLSDSSGRDPLAPSVASLAMKIDGHYDETSDIAWLRFADYHSVTVVSE